MELSVWFNDDVLLDMYDVIMTICETRASHYSISHGSDHAYSNCKSNVNIHAISFIFMKEEKKTKNVIIILTYATLIEQFRYHFMHCVVTV